MNKYKVTVLMSTYNGERFLQEQIDSILAQKDVDVTLCIRDDGSSDKTIEIIKSYKNTNLIFLERGENLGAKRSFMNLIMNSPQTDFYALSDQDDIWDDDKLIRALQKIQDDTNNDNKKPIMYHSALKLTDKNGVVTGKSDRYVKRGFLQGDTRSVTGCTIVFNDSLMKLLRLHMPVSFTMHDAWIHFVCLAVDGIVVYDSSAHIRYRQHGDNVIGGKKDLRSRIQRKIKYYRNSEKKQLSRMYNEILENYKDFMPEYNIDRCEKLCSYSNSWINTINVLKDSDYFRGRLSWGLEKRILVLLHKY